MTNKQTDKHDDSASTAVRRRDRMLNQIEVTRIQRLHAQAVSVAAIATHLGCARSTVYRWLAAARYRRQTRPQRDRLLAHRTWLAEQLTQHARNVPVVHRLSAKEHGIEVRLRTVQRFAASWLAEQRRTALLDRLMHHSHVLEIRGDSYRLREQRAAGLFGKPAVQMWQESRFLVGEVRLANQTFHLPLNTPLNPISQARPV